MPNKPTAQHSIPMTILRQAILGASVLVAGTSLALAGGSNQVCATDTIQLQTTNWSASATVPKFDPALGVLQSVSFELRGDVLGSAAIESLDAQPSTVTTDYQAALTLTRPDNSLIVVSIPTQQFVDNLSAFDGVADFAGTSGVTHGNISTSKTEFVTSSSALDLALFTGTSGNPGSIVLPISAAGSSNASGSGNLITQFLTDAGASVTVCYSYMLDCNDNGVDDAVDVSQGNSNDNDGDGIPDECQPGTRSFCEGDGAQNGGIDCPCQNNGGPGEGCENGTGVGGLLTATGVPSLSNDTLVLTATQIPQTSPGFFFHGSSGGQAVAGGGVPFASGINCLTNPIPIRKVNFGGTIPQGNMPPLSVFVGVSPGDTTQFQYWYRNVGGPCLDGSANTTNGIEVTWGL